MTLMKNYLVNMVAELIITLSKLCYRHKMLIENVQSEGHGVP
jgi:hypothetical protein